MSKQIMIRLHSDDDQRLKLRLAVVAKQQRRTLNSMAIIALQKGLESIDNKAQV